MGRTPCCDKANVKKGPWSPEEDAKLKDYIHKHGTGGNWISLPHKAGLRRCGKSCRLRWLNYLRPDIKHGDFSDEEDKIICHLFATIGSRWSVIAAQLPGRTDNDIKNYWNTKLKKKLMINSSTIPTSFLQPSSTSSSSSSPSSYSDGNPTNYPQPPPSLSFSSFDPISFSDHLLNNSSFSANGAPTHFIGPTIQNHHVNGALMAAGGEASCSSSDGSCSNVLQMGGTKYFRDCSSVNGMWSTETPLEYGIEEIKQLISSSSCSNVFFDETG